MTTTAPPLATASIASCTLDIGGMTCASCVGRVEKALNRVGGVAGAEVNLATEVATVRFDPATVGLKELSAAVARAGYTATPRREAAQAARSLRRPRTTTPTSPLSSGSGRSRSASASG